MYKVILEFWELDLSYLCNLRGPVPVTISSGDDCITVTDEFSVVLTKYDNGKELSLFILGT